jgi:hypothetical protein
MAGFRFIELLGHHYSFVGFQTPGAAEASIRELPPSAIGDSANFDTMGLVENCKGQPLPAIVEAVRDGSTVRVYLLPEFHYVQVYCAGVQVNISFIHILSVPLILYYCLNSHAKCRVINLYKIFLCCLFPP